MRPGAAPTWLPLPEGFFLGTMEEAIYETRTWILEPGDRLILYTDGVTEAMNEAKIFYTEDRLEKLMLLLGKASPKDIVNEILLSVRSFSGNEPQYDDITLLTLSFHGDGKTLPD